MDVAIEKVVDAMLELLAARMGLLYKPRAILRWRNRLSGLTLRCMLLAGECMAADAALQAGIASHVVAAGSALEKSRELASPVLAGDARRCCCDQERARRVRIRRHELRKLADVTWSHSRFA
ncbi:MAG: hypothetical protein IID58_07040 [Proteobacteria bacterium]|nr:hypothetical protein [Pseudomonadota bacterium]